MVDPAEHDYADWLARYRRAWIERDADAACLLFTEDAAYREQPFQEAFRRPRRNPRLLEPGDGVANEGGTPVQARAIVDGRRLAVEWWANLETTGGPITLAGEFLLRFADSGECRELRECLGS